MDDYSDPVRVARLRVEGARLPPAVMRVEDVQGVEPTCCGLCDGQYLVDGAPCIWCHSVVASTGSPSVAAVVVSELGYSPWEIDEAPAFWWRETDTLYRPRIDMVLPLWTPTGYHLGKRVLQEWIAMSRRDRVSAPLGPIEWKPVSSRGGARTQWNLVVEQEGFGRAVYAFDDGVDGSGPIPVCRRLPQLARVPASEPKLVPTWMRRAAGLAVVLAHFHDPRIE